MTHVTKIIWTSGEGRRNENKKIIQGSPKSHIKKVSPSSILIYGCSLHKDTCDILSEYLVSCRFQ